MIRRMTLSSVVAAAVLAAAPAAQADSWKHGRIPPGHARQVAAEYDYARVTRVTPIVRQVRVERPVRECWDEVRYHNPNVDTTARTLIGGIIGGIIGNQIGDGDGRRVATAAGAVIGSAVAHNSAVRAQARAGREYVVERCERGYETVYEERIEGYDVEYRYNGRTYHTRLPYDPGDRIRIRVSVAPAGR